MVTPKYFAVVTSFICLLSTYMVMKVIFLSELQELTFDWIKSH